ncbi:hypothetical protein DRQ05_03915 [bacterium]|nr:MAG: hypothetical protein DRQ05_03915 [bacterium]
MSKRALLFLGAVLFLFAISSMNADACTNIIVTKGASSDGSVMITYSCDGEFVPHLRLIPAADHADSEYIEIKDWNGKVRGRIKETHHTYRVVHLMNEHQLVIGETTFTGREELRNHDGLLHYWMLMRLALQRARSAREAVKVMGDLVDEYGYASTGETFSIGDPNEAWIMEMIGTGPGGKGAVWVALRVPDGYICAHANKARIGTFPMDDTLNCLHSDNVVSFAVEKGYYDPSSHKPFSFRDAYCPSDKEKIRYTATRVWSIFRRAASSLNLSSDYNRGKRGAEPYPLWIKPDHKLSLADVISLMRDHYEGTPFDMTKGLDAGPFGTPNRWRPIVWEVNGKKYAWERPISTQQTGFSFVSQSRASLPDAVGGVLWYGVDDTYTTCYFPLYCSINDLPGSFTTGDLQHFSWDSAWWVFNFVANFANIKYSYMIKDIQKVQSEIEGKLIEMEPFIDKTALALYRVDPELEREYVTGYSIQSAENIVKRWKKLGEELIVKYNDGYVKDKKGRAREVGYPEEWLKRVVKSRPKQFGLK